ncbi:MAG: transcriptional regulator [Alphaproteobacteria bacterium]|nr:transcriptional regulator [Alphaproteobacteria bacterium]
MKYGQFCPIAKATEILGERWTILIIRELLMGARRFSEFQRGLGFISPALLASRLKFLEDQGLVAKRRIQGQKGFEYFPTKAADELMPALMAIGEWGLCWARDNLLDEDFDVELLMAYLERSVDPDAIAGGHAVVRFEFTDLEQQRRWWLLVDGARVELCLKDPGQDVDVYITSSVRTMSEVWMGDRTYRDATRSGDLVLEGTPALTRSIATWLRPSVFADSPRKRPLGPGTGRPAASR